jgi:hypothetical protein
MPGQARTLFEKIWQRHVVADYGGGFALMHVDRLIVPDLSSRSLTELRNRGIGLARPELVFGVADHAITTDPHSDDPRGLANPFIANLREQARHFGLTMLEVGEPGHGIMHVISPELGIALPGRQPLPKRIEIAGFSTTFCSKPTVCATSVRGLIDHRWTVTPDQCLGCRKWLQIDRGHFLSVEVIRWLTEVRYVRRNMVIRAKVARYSPAWARTFVT